ncbi:MAG: zinc ribbon domain-containing protein [Acidobacteriota bacterium]|nr:zinc ribbon domain-containing protein [Acidobacteriota bacterium]
MIFYITSLGLIPFLASRALIPIFATALTARFAPGHGDLLTEYTGIELVSGLPGYLTGDHALIILGLGALVELVITKSPDMRLALQTSESGIRALTGFFLCFNLVEGDFMELVDIVLREGPTTSYVWGNSFAYTWSFCIGWAVFFTARLRGAIYATLTDMDEDDDLGVQGLMSWMEDSFGFFGAIMVFLMPLVTLIVAGMTLLGLYLFKKYLDYREERQKVPCAHCGHPNHRCAAACPNCQRHHDRVMQVGFLGIIKDQPVTDFAAHRFSMQATKRCYSCGERLRKKQVNQNCPVCGAQPFYSQRELDEYLKRVQEKLPQTLAICAAFSLIPIFGLIPGIIYYRTNLLSSMRAYIPVASGCMTRWAVRLVNLLLLGLQWVPLLGTLVLPMMCLVNYMVYRSVFSRVARSGLPLDAPGSAPVTSGV